MSNKSQLPEYLLTAPTGKFDTILQRNQELKRRVQDLKNAKIMRARSDGRTLNENDGLPTMQELGLSHYSPLATVFKPILPMASLYDKTQVEGGMIAFGSKATFAIPSRGTFLADMCLHVVLSGVSVKTPTTDLVKFVDYPGHKMIQNIRISHRGIVLQEYDSRTAHVLMTHKVPLNKRVAYERCVGQQQPELATYTQNGSYSEVQTHIMTGAQTYKTSHDDLEMWIPLWFWFKDIENAFPMGMLNSDDPLKVDVTFAPLDELLVMAYPTGMVPQYASNRDRISGSRGVNSVSVKTAEIISNQIFIHPDVFPLWKKSNTTHYIVRSYMTERVEVKNHTHVHKLTSLRLPTESLYVAFHPQVNTLGSTSSDVDVGVCYHVNQFVTPQYAKIPIISTGDTLAITSARYYKKKQCVDKLSLSVNGNYAYESYPNSFFSDYISMQHGKSLSSDDTPDWLPIHFCSMPGEAQPSGYINLSREREVLLSWRTDVSMRTNETVISETNPVVLYVMSVVMNVCEISPNTVRMIFN
jgi:hypothetical protein